jgi:pyruvate formate lyase activating enzyme
MVSSEALVEKTKEALLYEKGQSKQVRCQLCGNRCLLNDGQKGICQARWNDNGTLYTLVYGRIIAESVDPIEKKPLFHCYPGSRTYSIGSPGCNFHCPWCQNWQISQLPLTSSTAEETSPDRVVSAALQTGCRAIAYTYTEPTICFEFAYDTAQLAHESGLANVFVTNGYMSQEMLEVLHPYLDAAAVDLKTFSDKTYRTHIGGRLKPVLESLKRLKRLGIWVEVTTLLIPGINDDRVELRDIAEFLAMEIGVETPWHLSRFFPAYRLTDVAPTSLATLKRARDIGLVEGLHHVYLGNVVENQNTYCYYCKELLIERSRSQLVKGHVLPDGCCPKCGTPIAGTGMGKVWSYSGMSPRLQRGRRP